MHTLAILGIVAALIVLGLILWRNTCSLKHVINPTHRAGGYALPHALVLGIAFLAVFALGAFAGKTGAEYYASHFQANIAVPTAVHAVPDHRVTAPLANSINLARYPGVTTQDGLGACAAFATAWDLTYEYRVQHPTSWLRFSPRFLYDWYGATYSHGDFGSWPDQDAEVVNTLGVPKLKQYPYPPFVVASTFPTDPTLRAEAARYRMHVAFTNISGFAQGAGQGAVDGVKAAVTANHPVLIGLPVYPEYDNAGATGGLIDIPQPGEQSRGGHENVVIAYDDTKRFPSGAVGGVEVQNQWTAQWGLAGRAWLSYDFVRQYSFGLEYMRIAPLAPRATHGAPPPWSGMEHPIKPAPPVTGAPPQVSVNSNVRGIYATDRNLDLSPLINAAAHHFGLPPVGLASTLGAECGWATGVNGDCNRIAGWPDVSGGACQVSVQTAGGFGVGDGTDTGYNINNVFAYENVPANCIYLAARVLASYSRFTNLTFPILEVAWNCGPGYAYLTNPQGQCYTNYIHYLSWYQAAFSHAYDGPAPTPKPAPFPLKLWGHHVNAYSHHRLTYAATLWLKHGPRRAGTATRTESWHPSGHGGVNGYELDGFRYLNLFWWPRHANWTPKWHGK